MADDLREKLEGYKLQLEQVEAMLSTDPENEELKKLKEDLGEVLLLSVQLLNDNRSSNSTNDASEPSSSVARAARKTLDEDSSTQLPTAMSGNQKRKNREEELKRRGYKLAKKAKKEARQQEIELAHEAEKQRWLDFKGRVSKHNKSHVTKKSIFATTDNLNGRVGVGTCGTSGKPITPAPAFQLQRSAAHSSGTVAGPKPFGLDRLGF